MRWPFVITGTICIGAALTLLALPVVVRYMPEPAPALPPLPELGPAPAFALTDQNDAPFDSAALAGHVWVADFMFTTCPAICPILSTNMARVQRFLDQENLTGDVKLVSISIDPQNDTPEALRAYAQRFNADPAVWTFLTGDRDTIWALCRDGFKLIVTDTPEPPEDADAPDHPDAPGTPDAHGAPDTSIMHDGKLVLVDRAGRIRGYYDGTDRDSVALLFEDLPRLVNEPAAVTARVAAEGRSATDADSAAAAPASVSAPVTDATPPTPPTATPASTPAPPATP